MPLSHQGKHTVDTVVMKQHAGLYLRGAQLSADFTTTIWKKMDGWQVLRTFFFFFAAFVTELGVNNVLFMPWSEFWMRKTLNFRLLVHGYRNVWNENEEEEQRRAWEQETLREEREWENNNNTGVDTTFSTKDNKINACKKKKDCVFVRRPTTLKTVKKVQLQSASTWGQCRFKSEHAHSVLYFSASSLPVPPSQKRHLPRVI